MEERDELKARVWRMYLTYVEGQGQVVLCPWCSKPIKGDYALHEYLVKRSAVPKEKQHLIMVPENCIPWHNQSCHIPHGHSKKAAQVSLRAAAKRLTARAGRVRRHPLRIGTRIHTDFHRFSQILI